MVEKQSENDDLNFDNIIAKMGNTGVFQMRFAWAFNIILIFFVAFPHMNKIISLNVPEHWCHVPGRNNTNFTLEEWKHLTIPKEKNVYGAMDFSKCMRYTNFSTQKLTVVTTESKRAVTKCDHGWEYDRTWYDMTAPMQFNWVCDQYLIPTNALALGRGGEVVGAFVLGQLSDNYGRMPIFYTALGIMVFGRLLSIFTAPWPKWFLLFSFISCMPVSSVFQSALIIGMEISQPARRATISMISGLGWSVGVIVVSFFMWWLRDWMVFSLVTTVPIAIYFFSKPWIVESPRWLASHGNIKKCMAQFKKIAKTNKMPLPEKLEEELSELCRKHGKTKVYTLLKLFSSLRLAKNTIILLYCVATQLLIYVSLLLSVSNLSGNPYLNYFYSGLAELPAQILGKYLCDKFGRRLIAFIGYFSTFLLSLLAIIVVKNPSWVWLLNIICIIGRTFTILCYYTIYLQSFEIFPTCIRQTGASLNGVAGNLITILAPYIVTLGLTVDASIPYSIFAITALLAAIGTVFLPETRGLQVPDTLEDAAVYGANQDFWGREKRKVIKDECETPLT